MYYKIEELLKEHLTEEVGILDFANILKKDVIPEVDELLKGSKYEFKEFISNERLIKILNPEKGKQFKKSINKDKMLKDEVLNNLFYWIKIPEDYILNESQINFGIEYFHPFSEHELVNSRAIVCELSSDSLFKIIVENKYEIYKSILSIDRYNEYVFEALKIATKEQDYDSAAELIISNIDLLLTVPEETNESIFALLVDIYKDNPHFNKLYKKFNNSYTQEDYDLIRYFKNKVVIKSVNENHIKQYNMYMDFDINMKFANDNVNSTNYILIDKTKILNHKHVIKLDIELRKLIFGVDYIIENNLYKAVDLKSLVNPKNYHSLNEKDRKYFNEFGILTEELMDIVEFDKIVKNKSLTKELLNYAAQDNKSIDLDK